MVLLTMTQAMVEALRNDDGESGETIEPKVEDPSLDNPAIGKPISHGQILELYKRTSIYHLDDLLRGSKVYIEPPKPKPEQV